MAQKDEPVEKKRERRQTQADREGVKRRTQCKKYGEKSVKRWDRADREGGKRT